MPETLPMYPVWLVDVLGSALMIIFSFVCLWYARRLRRTDRDNVIWTYLLWLAAALALFSVSRSVGHIAKRVLLMAGHEDTWVSLRPLSGSINSIAFVIVAGITLFFQKVQNINVQVVNDKKELEKAGRKLIWLNANLEGIIRERTEELSRSEQNYRRLFEGSMDIIFILDRDGRFLDINQAGLTTLGYKSKETLAAATDFGRLLSAPCSFQELVQDIAADGFLTDLECQVKRQDGESLTLLTSFTVSRQADGSIIRFEGIAKDITGRKKMEQHLLQADRLASLGQLAAGVAHEVNNPLGMILGYTQLLLRNESVDKRSHQDLKIIEKHSRSCKTIVEDLLKFARNTETRKGRVDLNELVDEIITVLTHQFSLDNVTVEYHPDPDVPLCEGDGEKLKQVFMNLLMNAKQAIDREGLIVVSTRYLPDRKALLVEVKDTGSGIPAGIINQIFNPFFTTKPTGQGTGLGLSVSYGIIQDHQGDLTVDSTPGQGSTFTVRLPIIDGPEPGA